MRLEDPLTIQSEVSFVSFTRVYLRTSENTVRPALRIRFYKSCSDFEEIPLFDLDPQIESEIFETIKSGICELLEKRS